jgi:hypothetical protein
MGLQQALQAELQAVVAAAGAAKANCALVAVTTEALTTAAGSTYTLTLTNPIISARSIVFVVYRNGTNTQGTLAAPMVTPAAGSVAVAVKNIHATEALNGTLVLCLAIFNPQF